MKTKRHVKFTEQDYKVLLDALTYASVFTLRGPTKLSRKATKLLEKIYRQP